MIKEITTEMFLQIKVPNIIEKYMPKLREHSGVTSVELISEDINGKEYKFVGMFDPQTIVKRVKYLYQKEHDKYYKNFNKILKKELQGMKKEGLLEKKFTISSEQYDACIKEKGTDEFMVEGLLDTKSSDGRESN